jgi:hypothetical protein
VKYGLQTLHSIFQVHAHRWGWKSPLFAPAEPLVGRPAAPALPMPSQASRAA